MITIGRNSTRWARTSTIEEKLQSLQSRISDAESKLIEDVDAVESYVFFENISIEDGGDIVNIFTDFGYYFDRKDCNSFPDSTVNITFPSAIEDFVNNGCYAYVKKYGEFSVQTTNNMLVTTDVSDNFIQITGTDGSVYDLQKSHVDSGITFYRIRNLNISELGNIPTTLVEVRSYSKVESIAVDKLSVVLLTPIDMIGVNEMYFYGNILND